MSTERPRVQGYIDPELYQKLKEFQQERGLKESGALNQILKEYFRLEPSNQPLIPSLALEEMIEKSVNQKFEEFNTFRVEFKNEVWLQLKTQFNIWNQELHRVSNEKMQQFADSAFRNFSFRLTTLEQICQPIEGLIELSKPLEEGKSESPSELPKSVNGSELARRLGIAKSVISNRKARADFEEWSKGKDPEAIAWRYDRKSLQFFPVKEDRA